MILVLKYNHEYFFIVHLGSLNTSSFLFYLSIFCIDWGRWSRKSDCLLQQDWFLVLWTNIEKMDFLNSSESQTNPLRMLSTKSTISQKLKVAKIAKLIYHSFPNMAQLFGPKNENGSFWGERGRSACRILGINHITYMHDIITCMKPSQRVNFLRGSNLSDPICHFSIGTQ